MLRPEQFFFDSQGAAVEMRGARSFTLGLINGSQVIAVDRNLIMLRTVNAPEDLERAVVERFGFGILALAIQQSGQCRQISGYIRVIWSQGPLANLHGTSRERFAARVALTRMLQSTEV